MGSALLYSCGLIAHAGYGKAKALLFLICSCPAVHNALCFPISKSTWLLVYKNPEQWHYQKVKSLSFSPEPFPSALAAQRLPRLPCVLSWSIWTLYTELVENGDWLGHLPMWFPRAPCNSCGKEMKNQEAKEIYVWLSLLLFFSPPLSLSLHHQAMPTIESG